MNDVQARADTEQAAQRLPPVRQISVVGLRELMESERRMRLLMCVRMQSGQSRRLAGAVY